MPHWVRVEGTVAKSLCAGGDGSVWHVGTNNKLYRWRGDHWDQGPDRGVNAIRVAADRAGTPWHLGEWHVFAASQIYRWTGNAWDQVGRGVDAFDIAYGADVAWHVGRVNRALYFWNGGAWTLSHYAVVNEASLNGGYPDLFFQALAVDSTGLALHLGEDNRIYRQRSSADPVFGGWEALGPQADFYSVGTGWDGSIYGSAWAEVRKWNGREWTVYAVGRGLNQMCVDGAGVLWGRGGNGVFRYI